MASQTDTSVMPNSSWPANGLAWIGRQLLLVPEAVALLVLLGLHRIVGPHPLFAMLSMGLVAWFLLRILLLHLARRAVEAAQYQRGLQLARIALYLYPFSADTHALLGSLYLGMGQAGAAISALRQAVRYYPLQAGLHVALSAALLEDEQPQAALEEASRALQLDPRYAPAYLHHASAAEALNNSPDMIEAYLRHGLAHPATPADKAALRCALARVLLFQGHMAEAQQMLIHVESLLPASPTPQRAELHFQIGEILRMIGQPDAARDHFRTSEQLDPHGPYAAAAWRAARL
ncbi:TPR repeat-containing protein [Oscillochloris trichoides DG-6]|uniref:TPR repeat-containing protein n=1 Tax=Oscillochloris trichoides DG-6 TaxID=765420 RepID=E1IBV8_9CHLR|nr:tetratricopeptide repeat protein [Oscillochloris trichoides]EFO81338.1 TPR repeat-containing protein [Oscillochloris trichoides DG-6]